MLVRIAGITLKIQGPVFLRTLSQQELFNLRPFTISPRAVSPSQQKPVSICIHMFDKKGPAISSRERGLLVSKVESHLASCADKRLKTALLDFMQEKMFYYYPKRLGRLLLSVDFSHDDYSLTVRKNFLGLYRHSQKRFEAFLKSPPKRPIEHHNLGVLRLIMRLVLRATHAGVMLHASSAEDDRKRGVVFAGPSTSGKSTVISMLGLRRTFTDEFTLMRRVGSSYHVYASPWWNVDKKPLFFLPQKPALLRAVFFIQKAGRTSLRRMGYKESLATLACRERNLRLRGFTDDEKATLGFYLFAQQLVSHIPFFQLKVKKGPSFKKDFMRISSRL